ncbi:hypothetical protein EXIGLDRAFT_719241, partial [Exidia glandulosa HHB12029]
MPASASSPPASSSARVAESSILRRPIQYIAALTKTRNSRRHSVSPRGSSASSSARPRSATRGRSRRSHSKEQDRSTRSAPASPVRTDARSRRRIKHKTSSQTPFTTDQKVALLQLMDGGSTKKVRRRIAKASEREEHKRRKSDGVQSGSVGLGVEGGLHAEDGTYWRDQAERDEYTSLVTGDYVHSGRKTRRVHSHNSLGTRAASDDEDLVVVDRNNLPSARIPRAVAETSTSTPSSGLSADSNMRRGRPTARRPTTSPAEPHSTAGKPVTALSLARDAFFADSFVPNRSPARPLSEASSAPSTPLKAVFASNATSSTSSDPPTPRSRRGVQSLYVTPTSPLAGQFAELRVRARTSSLNTSR